MDDFSIADKRVDDALHDIKIINKYLGGKSTSITGINKLIGNIKTESGLLMLDVGAGGSDFLDSIVDSGTEFQCVSLDLNHRACKVLKNTLNVIPVNADALKLPFRDNSFDIVHASLFLHHFTEDEIAILLNEFKRTARCGIVINDLHRSILALSGIRILTTLFAKSSMVKNDAPLSVKRGFTKTDFVDILRKQKISLYSINWRWAFRWLIVIHK